MLDHFLKGEDVAKDVGREKQNMQKSTGWEANIDWDLC